MPETLNENTPLTGLERKETPLPWKKILLIGIILFGNTFSLCMVFPFLPSMTQFFFPTYHKSELGYQSGYLGSSFSMGSLCAAYFWGHLSDKIGRKPVLLAGLAGTFFTTLSFGYSQSFKWALMSRFLWGLLNGNIGVAKSYLAENLDSSNQARGFSVIGIQSGIGRLFGPAIGGLLAEPATKYKSLDFPLLREAPFLLPCLISASIALLGFIGTLIFLDEDHQHAKKEAQAEQITETYVAESPGNSPIVISPKNLPHRDNMTQRLETRITYSSNPGLCELLRTREIVIATGLYFLVSAIQIMSSDTIPLLLINSPEDGGLNFTSNEIGFLYMISAPFEIIFQVFIFPRLIAKYNSVGTVKIGLLSFAILIFTFPFASVTALLGFDSWVQWIVLLVNFNFLFLSALTCFTCIFVLVNNAGVRAVRGRVNGIGQTCASAARIISPTVSSIVLAWSEGNGLEFPLDYHLVYILASILSLVALAIAFKLPYSMNFNPDFE